MQTNTLLNNRYQLQKQLSNKAGRQTFLANDVETNTPVIAKILKFDQTFQWDEFKLFEREVQTLKNLDHPNIPKYLDYLEFEQDNIHYFALIQTYINAPSLESLIQEGRKFTEAEVKQLAEKILNILTYLHELNPPVTHRDIKPSNILLNNRSGNNIGDIYLVDFGAVQNVASKESGTITIVGSYGYIPLEQFSGQATPASDLYSLGMTLIYLLTGVHPADLPQENGRVKFNDKGISRPLVRWVEKMTYPYLNKRFSSATTALNNLYSNQISDGYHLNLKPDNSEVTLNCNGDKLEISIRTISYTTNFAMWLFISPFLSYILLCLSAVNPFSIIFVKLLSIIVFILVFIMFFFLEIVDYLTVISIEKDNEISLSYKFFDFIRWKKISSATQKINLIAYNPGYQFDSFLDSTGREQYQTATVKINPSLSVYAGTKEFKIGGKYPLLSQAEYWWLAQALSEFLELDVQVIYPTPKVPPEQNCDGC